MDIRQRAYQGVNDYKRLRQLLLDTGAPTHLPLNCSVGDLDWWRFGHGSLMSEVCIWENWQGELTGAAWLEDGEINQFISPSDRDVEGMMYCWAETRQRQLSGSTEQINIIAWSFRGDNFRETLLSRRGYVKDGSCLLHRKRILTGMLPSPILPSGYFIRQIDGQHELDQRTAIHCRAFNPSHYSAERHRSVMNAPTYRQDLDLVAITPNGDFAAFILLWYDPVNKHGVIEPMGTDPAYRRQGLGKALLAEGIQRLRALGATQSQVCTHVSNSGANQLYESSDFCVFAYQDRWVKTLV